MRAAVKAIPFARWPEADRAAWAQAIVNDGLFEKGPAAHWSAGSRESVLKGYKRWIGYLLEHEPDVLHDDVGARVTPERAARYARTIQAEVSPYTVFNYVKHLYDAVRVIVPTTDWSWLKRVATKLSYRLQPRSMVERFASVPELLDLANRLMDEASGCKAHVDYRDGVVIAVLAQHALRRRNIARIRICTNLIRSGEGFLLHFEGEE